MIVVDASALVALAALPIRRYSHDLLIPRVWQLRDNFSGYDGVYWRLPRRWTLRCLPAIGALPARPAGMCRSN